MTDKTHVFNDLFKNFPVTGVPLPNPLLQHVKSNKMELMDKEARTVFKYYDIISTKPSNYYLFCFPYLLQNMEFTKRIKYLYVIISEGSYLKSRFGGATEGII